MKHRGYSVFLNILLVCLLTTGCKKQSSFPSEFVGNWKLDEEAIEKAMDELDSKKQSNMGARIKMGVNPTVTVSPDGSYRLKTSSEKKHTRMRLIEKRGDSYVFRTYREENPEIAVDTLNHMEGDYWRVEFLPPSSPDPLSLWLQPPLEIRQRVHENL